MNDLTKPEPKAYALIPFLIFIGFYLGTGIILSMQGVEMAFYQIPSPISVIIGIISAFFLFKDKLPKKMETFVSGCADINIVTMCLIYILAGAFSTLTKSTGAVDSVVNMFLSVVPAPLITAGMFLIATFISTATGSSVGTIIALGQIAVGVADKGGLSMPLMLGAIVGGAMAGDNLSFISDTTIAATRTQNVEMKDKFRMNFLIMLPAVIVTTILLFVLGKPQGAIATDALAFNPIHVLPYIFVLATAIMGLDVFVVLISGVIISGAIGLFTNSFTIIEMTQKIFEGFSGTFEIFLLSMLTGGLANMVRHEGGIEWIIQKMRSNIKDAKSAEVAVATLSSLTDCAIANNTVSIVIVGPIAKDLSNEFHVDPRKMASHLDIFTCVFQGIIPYGAQLLIIAGFTNGAVSPVEIVPYVWYCFALAISAVVAIYTDFSKAPDPWNYEHDMPQGQVGKTAQ